MKQVTVTKMHHCMLKHAFIAALNCPASLAQYDGVKPGILVMSELMSPFNSDV